MKCPACQFDNRESAKQCRKCGSALAVAAGWRPTWRWHLTTLAVIYAALIVVYMLANIALKPYLRQIPSDITPWLKDVPRAEKTA